MRKTHWFVVNGKHCQQH